MEKKLELSFPILWDEDNQVAEAYGLKFEFPEALSTLYSGFGLDVPKANGTTTWQLPMPARHVIGTDGKIKSRVAHPDYKQRPEPEETLLALRSL